MTGVIVGVVPELIANWTADTVANIIRYREDNVKVQVKEITSELMMMKSYLKDANERQSEEVSGSLWLREIKALAYRIEDVVETFDIRVESRNEMNTSGMCFGRLNNVFDIKYLAAREVQKDIDKIRVELDKFREAQRSAGLTSYALSQDILDIMSKQVEHLVQIFVKESPVTIGGAVLYRVMSEVFSLGQTSEKSIVCIYSTDEVGRTLLARQILNHNTIQPRFKATWVDVPQEFSSRIVFERILCQFEKREVASDLEESELAKRLSAFQKKRRCLIVLNNIPSTDAWEMLKVAFTPPNGRRTKLLIVTSSFELAQVITAENGYMQNVRSPTGKDAWELINHYVTERDGPELNTGGTRDREEEPVTLTTQSTLQQLNVENDITEVTEGIEMAQQVPPLTYNDLPYELRPCVCYLAAFPEGTEIKAEKLYHLWMAEGLLSSDNYHSELSIAETYLNELYLGGMVDVQAEEGTTARRFKSCSLRNSIRPFWLMVGQREEFLMVLENGPDRESGSSSLTNGTLPQESDPSSPTRRTLRIQEPGPSSSNDRALPQESNPSSLSDKILRLFINVGQHANINSLGHLNGKLRCLLVRELDREETLNTLLKCIKQWRCLRILDFDGINFGNTTLPKQIRKLVHLRYLSFLGCLLQTLPTSICNLPYLQILDLRVKIRIVIPNVLHKMKRLRHLYLPSEFQTSGDVKLKLTDLTLLETLENFNTMVCDVKDLFTLPKLMYLSITVEGSLEDLKKLAEYMNMSSDELRSSVNIRNFDCYAEERHLVFRQLFRCHPLDVLYMEGHLGEIPPYGDISKNLSKIVLSGSEIHHDPMSTLEKLPKLHVLILNDDAFVGKEIICSASNFPELKHLELSNWHMVESWRIEEGAMPKLSALKIENCSRLKNVPEGLQFLTNLRELKILKMSPYSNRLREVGGGSGCELKFEPMPTLEKLPELQMLILNDDAFVGKEIICSASNFRKLRHLVLSDLSVLESWKIEEGAMSELSTLVVANCIQLTMLPDGLQFLTNLRELKIQRIPDIFNNWLREMNGESGFELEPDPMSTLEKLPNLWKLILNNVACVSKEIVCSAYNFPKLEHLELSNLSSLECWRIEGGAMARLSAIKIENCSNLKMLPDGVRFLTNLKKLEILGMPEPFNRRLREVDGERGEDMDKVPHDASIAFNTENKSSE